MSPDRYEELMSHVYAAAFGEAPPTPEGEGVARMLLEVAELVYLAGCGAVSLCLSQSLECLQLDEYGFGFRSRA